MARAAHFGDAMKLLLISVFAFFGLHTILWLGRSLVLVRKLQAEGKLEEKLEGKIDDDK